MMKLPWKYIILSFVIGLLLGGSVGLYYSHDLAHRWMKKAPEMFLHHLNHELHLDETQRTQILTILNATRDKVAAYQDEMRKTARAEIRTHLTSDQQARFDAMIAKHDAKRQNREGR
jgi:hypothetical protein